MKYESTKIIELGSCAFRQWRAVQSHCKYIHGYRLQAKFWFACKELDERNWVVDFGGLDNLKNILQIQFDHTLCVSADDPLLEGFKSLHTAGGCQLRVMNNGVGIERTAEWCFNAAEEYIQSMTKGRCWVEKVEVWEHEKNSAIVTREQIINNTIPTPFISNTNTTGNSETVSTTIQPPINQVRTFLEDVQQESGVNISNVIKNPPGSHVPNTQGPRPANVGNKTSTGFSNLFGGTSWGV